MKYVCKVCGWQYDGDDFTKESEDFVCPLCGAGKDDFEAIEE